MKTIVSALLISSVLASGMAMAEHELGQKKKAQVKQDSHLSWHEFRHELGSYPQIQANMNHHGVVSLSGHANDRSDRQRVERLAKRVRGAVEISNQISTD